MAKEKICFEKKELFDLYNILIIEQLGCVCLFFGMLIGYLGHPLYGLPLLIFGLVVYLKQSPGRLIENKLRGGL